MNMSDEVKRLGHAADLTIGELQMAVDNRSYEIDPEKKLGLLFFAVEFGGEAGEALNKIKKLEREFLGIPGSRSNIRELGDELADVIITACNVARVAGVPLAWHIVSKFNETSALRGLKTTL